MEKKYNSLCKKPLCKKYGVIYDPDNQEFIGVELRYLRKNEDRISYKTNSVKSAVSTARGWNE